MGRKALRHGFYIIDNKFILHFNSEVYRKFYPVIDFESFEVVESNGSTFHYFKDSKHVYVDSYMNSFAILPDARPSDFHILDFKSGKSSTGSNDYLFDQKLPHRFGDYRILSDFYQLADQAVYFNYLHQVKGADLATFELLYAGQVGNVAKDQHQVYFRDKIVEEADAASFSFLDACFSGEYYRECDHTYYAKDKNYAYYIDTLAAAFKIIKTKAVDQFQFKVIDEVGYAYDEKYRYRFGKREKLA